MCYYKYHTVLAKRNPPPVAEKVILELLGEKFIKSGEIEIFSRNKPNQLIFIINNFLKVLETLGRENVIRARSMLCSRR